MIIKNIYRKVFSSYYRELKKSLKGCESVLDVGCGADSPIKYTSKKFYSVGVDIHQPSIEKSKQQNIHNEYLNIDIMDIENKFKENSFDCVLASDIIEHLPKEQGLKLLDMMEKIARKKVIILTPNGFLPQGEYNNNPFQIHKSGWTVREFREKEYKVIGISGLKSLRGEFAMLKYKPKLFWLLISDLTQLFVKHKPEKAFQLLCMKTIP